MNRLFFVLAILGLAGFLSYFSIFAVPAEPATRNAAVSVDLSDGIRYESFSTGAADGKTFTGRSVPSEGYLRLSPIAGVSYAGGDVPKISGNSVSIGKGLYFFRLGDIFRDISVEHSDFRIRTIGRGNFYLDTRDPVMIKMFSVSALLAADLLSGKRTVTTAHVFPSTYFGYSPAYNTELKNADILRIATVNTIRYVDLKNASGDDPVLGKDAEAREFFAKNLEFEKVRADEFGKAYSEVFRLTDNVPKTDLSEEFGWYFVNLEKKSAILRGKMLRSLRNLAVAERCEGATKCPDANKIVTEITDVLSDMESVNPELKRYGISAINQAYYLSYYEPLRRNDAYFRSKTSNAFVSVVTHAVPSVKIENADYALLSEMHAAHYYGDRDSDKLDDALNSYVRSLLSGKAIRKTEFLPFSFFLKEYLSREGFVVNRMSLDIAFSLVAVSNEYYETLSSDDQKFSTLTVLYYTYAKIFDRIRKANAAEFLEQREEGVYLKDSYVDQGGNPDLPTGFADSFEALVEAFETPYFKTQRTLYASFLGKNRDRKVSDTSTLLDKSLSGLKEQLTIFTDYGAYKQRLALDESSREASGLVFEKEYPSEDEIRKYFSEFTGVETDTLKVINDPKKDGYSQIDVQILGRPFSFRLFSDEGYRIEGLTFVDGGKEIDSFKHTSVSLDEKRDLYQREIQGLTPTDPKYPFYVFANYFTNTYLSQKSSSDFVTAYVPEDEPDSAAKRMDPETLVFVEQELIRKDFMNVSRFFPVKIANIEAKIVDKTWDISLSGIRRSFSKGGTSYTLEFSGKYLFDQHSFYRLTARAINEASGQQEFGGATIQIFPRNVPLTEIQSTLDPMFDFIAKVYSVAGSSSSPNSVVFNLLSNKVVIDGVEYDVERSR